MLDDVESRYTHLLQPIRDMTKNWEVDVAAQLGEYLEELDQICISFDGGKTTMNFAEAALLIQGSACIYSKKVEYLYTLVYQALDFISNKKRDQQPPSVGEDGVDKDANFPNNNDEEEFLSLDDISDPKKTNVDLKKDQNPNLVNIVPLTPMALVPPEEVEKKNNPLCSRKGEILASRKDFRMNTCTPHACGAFMLELALMSPTQFMQNIQRIEDASFQPGVQNVENKNENMEAECNAPVPVLNFSDDNGNDDGFVPLDEHHEEDNVEMEPIEHIERQQIQTEDRGYMLRQREMKEIPVSTVKNNLLDPWRSLDPFESSEEKPFKKGKHYTVPRGVVDDLSNNKRKRRLTCKLQDFMKWFTSSSWDGAEEVKSRRKGPTFADMEVLYWKHAKERLAAQRQLQKRMGPQFAKVAELLAEDDPVNHVDEIRDADYLDNDDGADLSDHEDLDLNVPACLREEPACADVDPMDLQDQLTYEELVRRNVELFIANSQKYAQETVLSLRVREWEDKMGPQLQEQEERGAFDIHDYGDRLVSQFNKVGEWRSFASLMAHKQPYEVCRYMLASLQLANDYTVEVSQKPGLSEGLDTMSLRLLSQQKAHERFKTYTAPSVAEH
ncbi:condensin-2 complex subunit H2 [Hyla sarda]|uniref:condensin-2 complex subunit H2 n=1 Tax=Hyla sarda TaxID=327740 RepID=UPI0024C4498E|nr:condensin-2 complex subunit H2 [Hyla sarda]XP_056429016.1 condensin-2 complex subunit H2 [Hyla sarda]XP_056429017.1 condensin-2 complex subunit H2 [Hyla sarda]XP_056429018.1 condensin-2 complex subunit H2 [Hyla sarda]